MVTMSNVWDRAGEVMRARAGQLGWIAVLTLFVPAVVRDAVPLVAAPGSAGFIAATALIAPIVLVIATWGQLALLATAADPAIGQADAFRRAGARLPAALAVTIVAVLVLIALVIPVAVAVGLSGANLSAMATSGTMPAMGSGTTGFVVLYMLALAIGGLLVTARLILTNAVVLNERRGLGAFARSWRLTRGLTWRIAGAVVLYVIVLAVAVGAAQLVTGAVAAVILGRTPLVVFLAALAARVATTLLSVVAIVFIARLYGAVAGTAAEAARA